MPKLPGAGFSTDGKQSGCRLESGRDMLHTVVKFGSCNELTVDHIHHLKTNLQCKTCVVFEKAVVDASQDDSLSAKLPCRGPFEASTRLQARGLLPSQLTRQIFVVIFGSESQV